jgi:DNA-binding MarR family transcriptional regulator
VATSWLASGALANVDARPKPIKRTLGPLSVGAGPISRGLLGDALDRVVAIRLQTNRSVDRAIDSMLSIAGMRRTPGGDAFTEIVTRGLLLGALLEEAGDTLTAAEGQSAARWKVLGVVAKQERTVAKIALSLKLSRQAVQRVADVLAADGLVEYLDNPDDRRANLLALTSRGRHVLSAIQIR